MMKRLELIECLQSGGREMEDLFARARAARQQHFEDKIFLYGFVYFSTYCGNNCRFCYYRRDNQIERYRKLDGEILEVAQRLAESGVHMIDLTMGEDERYRADGFRSVANLIREIKAKTRLPVMISPGVVEREVIDRFARSGADFFALYQETHNQKLFESLRIGQSYQGRMDCKLYARERGMLTEEGILAGVGETFGDIADSLLQMDEIGATQIRVMSFVPQEGSPMQGDSTPDRDLELKIIALMRILHPGLLIPASLDVDGMEGLQARLDAGANVVTSIIPPGSGLAGVARGGEVDVEHGGRDVESVCKALGRMGLRRAEQWEFDRYLQRVGQRVPQPIR